MYAIKACLFSKLFHCNVSFQVMLEKRQSPIYFPPAETNNPDNEETPVASPVASEQGHSHLLRVTGNGIPPANELQTFAVIPSHSYYFWYGDFNVENNIADTCGSRFYYSRWRPPFRTSWMPAISRRSQRIGNCQVWAHFLILRIL